MLVYAHREEDPVHDAARRWLADQVEGPGTLVLTHATLSGFLRVVTLPGWRPATPLATAIEFVEQLLALPNCVTLTPGPRHWEIFRETLRGADARGRLVPDAHIAAVAIEHGATIATRDRGFARFPGLRWLDPLAGEA